MIKTSLAGRFKISLPAFEIRLKGKPTKDGLKISLPSSLRKKLANEPAVVIKVENGK